MAVRLSVLILKPSPEFQNRFEQVVGELLGRPGLDVVMLERIPLANEEATESLALEGLSSPIACLTWSDFSDVQHALAAAGHPLTRRQHTADPDAGPVSAGESAAYFFDLRPTNSHVSILQKLQALHQRLNVTTFSLNGLSPPPRKATPAPTKPPSAPPPVNSRPPESPAKPSVDRTLDQLVDDLDEMDL